MKQRKRFFSISCFIALLFSSLFESQEETAFQESVFVKSDLELDLSTVQSQESIQDEALDAEVMEENFDAPLLGDLSIHGFVSQGYQKSSANNFYAPTKKGTFSIGEVGLVFRKELTENLDVGIQLFAQKLGEIRDFTVKVDWAFGDYRFCEPLNFRIGKVKVPIGFWNEIRDVDPARTFIWLPQGFYPEMYRPYMIAILGAGIYGKLSLCQFGDVFYEALYGVNDMSYKDALFQNVFFGSEVGANIVNISENVYSRRFASFFLDWHLPFEGLRLALSYARGVADIVSTFNSSIVPFSQGSFEIPGAYLELWALSFQYTFEKWIFTLESYRTTTNSKSFLVLGAGIPPIITESRAIGVDYHGAIEYALCQGIVLGAYYDELYFDKARKADPRYIQKDAALAVRFDITPHFILKFEGHRIRGTALLLRENNPDPFSNKWWLGAVKATFVF